MYQFFATPILQYLPNKIVEIIVQLALELITKIHYVKAPPVWDLTQLF